MVSDAFCWRCGESLWIPKHHEIDHKSSLPLFITAPCWYFVNFNIYGPSRALNCSLRINSSWLVRTLSVNMFWHVSSGTWLNLRSSRDNWEELMTVRLTLRWQMAAACLQDFVSCNEQLGRSQWNWNSPEVVSNRLKAVESSPRQRGPNNAV
jgi:hypothetical protein